jgi:hypothetical protein
MTSHTRHIQQSEEQNEKGDFTGMQWHAIPWTKLCLYFRKWQSNASASKVELSQDHHSDIDELSGIYQSSFDGVFFISSKKSLDYVKKFNKTMKMKTNWLEHEPLRETELHGCLQRKMRILKWTIESSGTIKRVHSDLLYCSWWWKVWA